MGIKWDNGESMNELYQSDYLCGQGRNPVAIKKVPFSRPSTVPGSEGLPEFRLQYCGMGERRVGA